MTILGGGMARIHLYLVEGDPGTGKTTIAMQFLMEGIRRGQTGLYITLSESKPELLEITDSHGWCLNGIELFEFVADETQLQAETQYTVFSPSEIELADTTNSVLAEIERVHPLSTRSSYGSRIQRSLECLLHRAANRSKRAVTTFRG